MGTTSVAEIRAPNDDELRRMREIWGKLQQDSLQGNADIGVELQSYLKHCAWIVGLIVGLNVGTGEDEWPDSKPVSMSQDGVARIRDSMRMLSAVLALWTPTGQRTIDSGDKPQ